MTTRLSLLTAAAALLLPATLRADTLTLQLPSTSAAGTTEVVSGTFTNTTSSTELLNGDSFQFNLPGGVLNDSPFFSGAYQVAAGASLTEQLFLLTFPSGTAPGTYSGRFSILGGTDPNAFSALASTSFSVTIPSPNSVAPVPEPPTVLLLLTGTTAALGGLVLRRRKAPLLAAR